MIKYAPKRIKMQKQEVRLRQYNGYIKDKDNPNQYNSLLGEIYEMHAFCHLINERKDIRFLLAKSVKPKPGFVKYGFCYNKQGQIVYKNAGVGLGEFDILGLGDDGRIYWYEVSIKEDRRTKRAIAKKKALLSRLFPRYEVCFCMINPQPLPDYSKMYKTLILPLPRIKRFYPTYRFKCDFTRTLSLEEFAPLSLRYDYIGELISHSREHFSYENIEFFDPLFLHLFDIERIFEQKIRYYDFEKKIYRDVEFLGRSKVLRDGEILDHIHATYKEILEIRRRLRAIKKRKNLKSKTGNLPKREFKS